MIFFSRLKKQVNLLLMSSDQVPLTLELVVNWARSGYEWEKVYRFLFVHPEDLFTIPNGRSWSIAHQIVYHGDVDLFKRILALYSDDQINIHTLSKDQKTLLDVAISRRIAYPDMCTYMEHLFLQDDLIQAGKQSDWRLVNDILDKDNALTNEKPPYSTYFLLHYIVQNGNKDVLQDFIKRFPFQTNVLSADNETAADIAKRLKKDSMCSILESTNRERPEANLGKFKLPEPPSLMNTSNENQNSSATIISTIHPSASSSSTCPYPTHDPFPCPSPTRFSLNLNTNGNFVLGPQSPFGFGHTELPPTEQQIPIITTTQSTDAGNMSLNQSLETNLESMPMTPVTPASNAQLLKNLTCPLTHKIFVDPVIAGDGQTYEREAIAEWVNLYRCSPRTGVSMNAKFVDNVDVKQIVQSMRKQH